MHDISNSLCAKQVQTTKVRCRQVQVKLTTEDDSSVHSPARSEDAVGLEAASSIVPHALAGPDTVPA